MSDRELRDHLTALVMDEPPLHLGLDPVVARGQRLRTRRRLAYAGSGLVAAAVVGVAIVVPFARSGDDTVTQRVFAAQPPLQPSASGGQSGSDEPLTPNQRRVADAIEAASPADWTFEMSADRWEPGPSVEATADDGTGPGRLLLGLAKPTGSYIVHPCSDSEFAQGASCTERTLDNGAFLTRRGVVDADGRRYLEVVLTYPNGAGVSAESANFVLEWPPSRVYRPEDKMDDLIHVTRADPTYTLDQLERVDIAVDQLDLG